MEVYSSVNEQLLSQTKPSVLVDRIEFKLNENENNLDDNKLLKQQYNFLRPDPKQQERNGVPSSPVKQNGIKSGKHEAPAGTTQPKFTLCSPDAIQLEWKHPKGIGAGYMNLGNTCFMNSVLQALTYCPPLVNYLLHSNKDHLGNCRVVGLCMTCELTKHMRNSYQNTSNVIRPQRIFSNLKQLARHFQPGRQEDSHEFLRYVIDNIWKSCVINWESARNGIKLDSQSKETTFINQMFGGYHRSQITCLSCKAKSDTYDHFMDFILDIKSVSSLEKALEGYNQPEILRNENAYKCSNCCKKVPAEKRFTVYRAPNVATFQLKRFDYNRIFGGKITKQISYPETLNLRPYMSESKGEPINYRLFAVLVHLGSTSNSGHYFCYVRSPNNAWYLMDDARVSSTSLNQVLDQQAYMLFYVRVANKDGRGESLNKSLLNSTAGSPLAAKLNNKPNGLISNCKLEQIKKLNSQPNSQPNSNAPKLICENVNTKQSGNKPNGESKPVNSTNSSSTNRLSILSDLDNRVNSNLSKSLSKSLPALSNGKSATPGKQTTPGKPTASSKPATPDTARKPEEKKVEKLIISKKRLVPYENNSSDEEQLNGTPPPKRPKADDHGFSLLANQIQASSEKEKKQLVNSFARFAEELGGYVALYGEDGSEDDQSPTSNHVKTPPAKTPPTKTPPAKPKSTGGQESSQSKSLLVKIPLLRSDETAQPTPTKTAANRTYSPVKTNGFLSNNYYQSKQAANPLTNHTTKLNLSRLPSSETWVVGQSPVKCKTSSIASGSSTNSINSTTEWQVIDRTSANPKSDQRPATTEWQVADRVTNDDSDSARRSSKPGKAKRSKDSDAERRPRSTGRELVIRKDDESDLNEAERRFMKKLRKIERKDKRKYEELRADSDAMQALFLRVKRKLKNKKQRSRSSDDDGDKEERKHKKHKHRRADRSSSERSPVANHSLHSSRDSTEATQQSNQSLSQSKVISPQKNGNGLSKKFNEQFGYEPKKQKDMRSELNEMHLNLLGKNVNTWDGRKTQIDRQVKEELERDKKRSKDDLYNEDYDKGKIKKVKAKSDDEKSFKMKENPFQKVYEQQYMKNDKSKFIKSL